MESPFQSRISSRRYRPIVYSDEDEDSNAVLPPPTLAPAGRRSLLPLPFDDIIDDIPSSVSDFLIDFSSILLILLYLESILSPSISVSSTKSSALFLARA